MQYGHVHKFITILHCAPLMQACSIALFFVVFFVYAFVCCFFVVGHILELLSTWAAST